MKKIIGLFIFLTSFATMFCMENPNETEERKNWENHWIKDVLAAAAFNKRELVGFLLKKDPEQLECWAPGLGTPLMIAAMSTNECAVKILVDYGANPNPTNDVHFGKPIQSILFHNQINSLRILLECGADPNAIIEDELSPLLCISTSIYEYDYEFRKQAALLLLSYGAFKIITIGDKTIDIAQEARSNWVRDKVFTNIAEIIENFKPEVPTLKHLCLVFLRKNPLIINNDTLNLLPIELRNLAIQFSGFYPKQQ